MKRLFIGIPIESSKLVQQIEIWKKDPYLNRNVLNWTIPKNWHITLFFLGNTEQSAIPVLDGIIDESFHKIQAYQTEFQGVGVFPNTNNPKVLWLGLKDIRLLELAYSQLGELLRQNGFSFDQKQLKPHLTIARVKRAENPSAFQSLLSAHQETVFDCIEINRVILYESITTPSWPIYRPLFTVRLI